MTWRPGGYLGKSPGQVLAYIPVGIHRVIHVAGEGAGKIVTVIEAVHIRVYLFRRAQVPFSNIAGRITFLLQQAGDGNLCNRKIGGIGLPGEKEIGL